MADIKIKERFKDEHGWVFEVEVSEGKSSTQHTVSVSKDDYERLTGGNPLAGGPKDLVKKSFEFLLEREPKESILREFDITKISYYFPEYEKYISNSRE